MDKPTLLEKINKSNITKELKTELVEMVSEAQTVDQGLLDRIGKAIDREAENLIEEIANTELQVETDKYERELGEVEKQVDQFAKELNKKADKIDIDSARAQINS